MSEITPVLPVRLIALGSALGADQIGWLAARRLDAAGITALYPEKFLEIEICPSPALLVTQCSSVRALILLDAYCSADPVGTVRNFSVEEFESLHHPASSHGFDISQVLAIRSSLEAQLPPVRVIGVCIGDRVDIADVRPPSEILELAFPALLEIIDLDVQYFLSSDLIADNVH